VTTLFVSAVMSAELVAPRLVGDVVALLYRLQSPVTATIHEAEAEFDQLVATEPVATYDVLSFLCTAPAGALGTADPSAATVIRSAAAVLLRQRIATLEKASIGANAMGVITRARQRLLLALQTDGTETYTPSELRKICAVVAALGGAVIAEHSGVDSSNTDTELAPWPELFSVVYALATSTVTRHRASGLNLLACLLDYLDDDALRPHLRQLHEILRPGLMDPDAEVREHAIEALRAILETAESKDCMQFRDMIPLLGASIETAMSAGDEEDTRKTIEEIIEMLQCEPRLFRDHFGSLASSMLALMGNTDLEDETRQIALEFLTVCAEHLRSSTRKNQQIVEQLITACMHMMTEIDDEKEWYEKDSLSASEGDAAEDDSGYSNLEAAQGSLDRIAIALGGKIVVPKAFRYIDQFLQRSDDWRFRYAAIMTINQIGEGCEKHMERQLGDVLKLVVGATKDPHPRVRWAAINCIGQMSTDFGGTLQRKFHRHVVPTLIDAMDDACNRVRSHAAAALINFCDEASAANLIPYLDTVVGKLIALLNSNSRLAIEQAMTAVAAVAGCVGTAFNKYYDDFMPPLKHLLRQTSADDKWNRLLRSKAMECMTLIGVAVGAERFRADADEIMQILVSSQMNMEIHADDPQLGYMMQAYARICQSLGKQFEPYLPYVLPTICEMARLKPDMKFFPGQDEKEAQDANDYRDGAIQGYTGAAGAAVATTEDGNGDQAKRSDDGYTMLDLGNKKLGIRAFNLEDRAIALSILASFAAELKGSLFPYLMDITQIIVENLEFWYHDECRQFAAEAIPDLVECTADHFTSQGDVQRSAEAVREIVSFFLPKLCHAAQNEPEVEVQVSMIEALDNMLEVAGDGVLSTQQCLDAACFIFSVLKERQERVRERLLTQAEDYELDDDEIHNLEEEDELDDEVLFGCSNLIRTLLKHNGPNGFFAAFQTPIRSVASTNDDDDNDDVDEDARARTSGRTWRAEDPTTASETNSTGMSEINTVGRLFASMISQEHSPSERSAALNVWAAWLEFSGPLGVHILPQAFQAFAAYLKDTEAHVQAAAAYGIRICAECTEQQLFAEMNRNFQITESLEQLVLDPNARDDEDAEKAADKAASALLQIAIRHPQCITAPTSLKAVLDYLPLQAELGEADAAITALIQLPMHAGLPNRSDLYDMIPLLIARQVAVVEGKLKPSTLDLVKDVFARMPPAALQQMLQRLASIDAAEYELFHRLILAARA
jgi:HEAT repeat protein